MLVASHTPLYSSATLLTGVGVAVAIVAIVISIILWHLGSPRRLLVYSYSDTALLRDAREQVGSELQVILSGHKVSDPHMTSLFLESRSRRDIRRSDFEESRLLVFELGTPILKLLNTDIGGARMPEAKLEFQGKELSVGPNLINRR